MGKRKEIKIDQAWEQTLKLEAAKRGLSYAAYLARIVENEYLEIVERNLLE